MWSNQGPVRDGEADVVAFLKPPLSRATINPCPLASSTSCAPTTTLPQAGAKADASVQAVVCRLVGPQMDAVRGVEEEAYECRRCGKRLYGKLRGGGLLGLPAGGSSGGGGDVSGAGGFGGGGAGGGGP
jgi:hypothetical protein